MIIQSSNVAMASKRSYSRTTAVSTSLTTWGSGFMQNRNTVMVQQYNEESGSGKRRQENAGNKNDLFNQFKQAQSIGSPVSITKKATPDAQIVFDFNFDPFYFIWQKWKSPRRLYQQHYRTALHGRAGVGRDLFGIRLSL